MIIRRNVYFSAFDEQTGEERLYSTTELMDEETYLEAMFSEDEDDEEGVEKRVRIPISDRLGIAGKKYLQPKKYRDAKIAAYEDGATSEDRHRFAKEGAKLTAKVGAGTTALVGGIAAGKVARSAYKDAIARTGGKHAKMVGKIAKGRALKAGGKTLAGATAAGLAATGLYAGATYAAHRGGSKLQNGINRISATASRDTERDNAMDKVAAGKMSREDYAKKWGAGVEITKRHKA